MSKKTKWGFSTKSIHIGNDADKELGSVAPPIHLTSTFKQDAVGKNRGHDYSGVIMSSIFANSILLKRRS